MPRVSRSEFFNGTDDTPLSVAPGVFVSSGDDQARTGATNARSAGGREGLFGFRSASQQHRVNLLTIVALLALVMILLPMLISAVGTARREALLAEERNSDNLPEFVLISPEVDEAKNSVNHVLGAYAMSSGYVPDDVAEKMRELLEQVSATVHENDAGRTRKAADGAREYFVETYAPALSGRGIELADEWGAMNWETYSGIEDSVAALKSSLPSKDVDAIAKRVIDLSTLLGQGRDEHFKNRVTYVPPPPPAPEPEPTQTEEPKKTEEPKPSEAPQTEDPKPEEPEPEPQPTEEPQPDLEGPTNPPPGDQNKPG